MCDLWIFNSSMSFVRFVQRTLYVRNILTQLTFFARSILSEGKIPDYVNWNNRLTVSSHLQQIVAGSHIFMTW
jgi:hypothetical protein